MLFNSHKPDLIILDLGLPDLDGKELLKKIRREHLTPIIVLSARSDEKDKILALDLGANDYVTKPFGSGELVARVRSCLRNSATLSGGGHSPGKTFESEFLTETDDLCIVALTGGGNIRNFIADQQIRILQNTICYTDIISVKGRVCFPYFQ